jgi:hypothetical protein
MALDLPRLASLLVANPSCPKCGIRMMLVRVLPDRPGSDVRTYECPRCEHEVIEIVQYRKAS